MKHTVDAYVTVETREPLRPIRRRQRVCYLFVCFEVRVCFVNGHAPAGIANTSPRRRTQSALGLDWAQSISSVGSQFCNITSGNVAYYDGVYGTNQSCVPECCAASYHAVLCPGPRWNISRWSMIVK